MNAPHLASVMQPVSFVSNSYSTIKLLYLDCELLEATFNASLNQQSVLFVCVFSVR